MPQCWNAISLIISLLSLMQVEKLFRNMLGVGFWCDSVINSKFQNVSTYKYFKTNKVDGEQRQERWEIRTCMFLTEIGPREFSFNLLINYIFSRYLGNTYMLISLIDLKNDLMLYTVEQSLLVFFPLFVLLYFHSSLLLFNRIYNTLEKNNIFSLRPFRGSQKCLFVPGRIWVWYPCTLEGA